MRFSVFKSLHIHVTDGAIRAIVDSREFGRLADNPKVSPGDVRALDQWREIITEYVKDYVSLNQASLEDAIVYIRDCQTAARCVSEETLHPTAVGLSQVFFLGFNGVGDVQAEVAEFLAQGLAGDAQQAGGLVLIPPGVLQDTGQQEPVQLAVRVRV